jgi:hypothetical protein
MASPGSLGQLRIGFFLQRHLIPNELSMQSIFAVSILSSRLTVERGAQSAERRAQAVVGVPRPPQGRRISQTEFLSLGANAHFEHFPAASASESSIQVRAVRVIQQ